MANSFVFNPFTSNFDSISQITLTTVGSSPNSNGASLDNNQNLTLEPADGSNPGLITASAQTIGGDKTFTGNIIDNNLTANTALIANGSQAIASSSTTSTELSYVHGVTSSIQTQLNSKPNASSGDINETSFNASNNVSSAANVTGLAFNNSIVRSANILLSVYVNATTSLYEFYTLNIIQNGSGWYIGGSSIGDNSGFVFTITSAGQIQYTNSNYSGFTAATIKFRAQTLSV